MPPRGQPIRVCLIAPSLDIVGGQSIQAARLLARLQTLPALEVSFLPINPRLPGILRALQQVKYVRTIVTTLAFVATLCRRVPRADVLHIFSPSYWAFLLGPAPAILIGKLFRKRVLLNYHSGEAEDHLRRWRRTAVPLLRRTHRIVVPSEFLVDVFQTFGLDAHAIPNFVEIESIPHRERSRLRPALLSNRNLEPHYNVACVLHAFARIREAHPDAELVIAGEGSERKGLEALAAQLGLQNATFRGQVDPSAMGAFYDAADVYVNASDIDNMPLSILEAQAAGLPVVTTKAGGIPYMVEHERTGLLVDQGDAQGLTEAVQRLLEDPFLVERLTHAARERCMTHYTWAAVAEQWVRCYGAMVEA